ncbi:MAG: MBL fold metallo-hydrolase [Candidatus Nealsonbacteria bacterium]|nr:MBL fold metallo-hydrolase [Candidatus Nealsonbacteria bacterium]
MKKNPVFVIFGILAVLFCLNILAWVAAFEFAKPQLLEVTFFDVGQGDAIFIETPERWQTLIDGGPTSAVLEKLGKEMPFWDRTIDLVILSHPEHDHVAGLIEVLKRYEVKNVLWTGVVRDTEEYKEWVKVLNKENAKIIIAQAGQKIDVCHCEVLHPFESLEGQEFKDSNNTSVIIKLVFGETSFLFTGDAYKSIERQLLGRAKQQPSQTWQQLDSDVLKVGHHGSKTSTAPEFIGAVSPEVAVISVGKDNKYGHPHQETLETLSGIEILRTDQDGDIKIISDGASHEIE